MRGGHESFENRPQPDTAQVADLFNQFIREVVTPTRARWAGATTPPARAPRPPNLTWHEAAKYLGELNWNLHIRGPRTESIAGPPGSLTPRPDAAQEVTTKHVAAEHQRLLLELRVAYGAVARVVDSADEDQAEVDRGSATPHGADLRYLRALRTVLRAPLQRLLHLIQYHELIQAGFPSLAHGTVLSLLPPRDAIDVDSTRRRLDNDIPLVDEGQLAPRILTETQLQAALARPKQSNRRRRSNNANAPGRKGDTRQ